MAKTKDRLKQLESKVSALRDQEWDQEYGDIKELKSMGAGYKISAGKK